MIQRGYQYETKTKFQLLSNGPSQSHENGVCSINYWSVGSAIKRSSEPNAETRRYLTKRGVVIVVLAKKDIKVGQEITIGETAKRMRNTQVLPKEERVKLSWGTLVGNNY